MSSSANDLQERSRLLSEIGEKSLLEVVPGLSELVLQKGDVRMVPAGRRICREGAEITHYMMPLTEGLNLVHGSGAARKSVGFLARHRSLALRQLLEDQPYPYGVMTEGQTLILILPKQDFLALVRSQPPIEHYLRLISSSASLRNFKQFLTDRKVGSDGVLELFSTVRREPRVLAKGGRYQPKEPQLCFVDKGRLDFVKKDAAGATITGSVGSGAWFGGESLVPPFRASYELVAAEETTYLTAVVDELEPVLSRLGILDRVYDDPWINIRRPSGRDGEAGPPRELSLLPGRLIEDLEALSLGLLVLGPERTSLARSDDESYVASSCNIAALLDVKVNLTSIKTDLALAPKLGMLKLAESLEPYGLCSKCLSATPAQLSQQMLPGLIRLGPRLVVLLQVSRSGKRAWVLDPARGVVELAGAEFAPLWDGQLLWVYASRTEVTTESFAAETGGHRPQLDPMRELEAGRRHVLGAFLELALKFRPTLFNALGLAVGGFGLSLLMPAFSQLILDEVLTLRDTTTLRTCVIGMLLVTVMTVGVAVTKMLLLSEFSYRFDHLFSSEFYRHALALPTRFFGGRKAGGILARLNEITVIRDFISNSSIQSLTDLLSILIFSGVLFAYSWKVALVPLTALPLMVLVQLAFRNRLAANYDQAFEADSLAKGLLTEQVSAITTVKALGAETAVRKLWEKAHLTGVQFTRRAQLDVTAFQGLTGFLSRLITVVGIWVAATLALKGEITPGGLLAITMYLDYAVGPINNIADIFSKVAKVRVAFNKLSEVVLSPTEQPASQAASTYSLPLKGKIRFERVSFRYSDDAPWVLRDVTMTIYPRQLVAIVGRSGCGKTTLANLVAGNLKPTSGRIFFDDFDSAFLSLSSLRAQLGFIIQSRDLFSGTIGENIAYADDAPEQAAIEQAASDANATEFINVLPAGYQHFLGEGGLGLSGGQMQRLSIARTLYRQPKILIMDEATSALDFETERMILQNMKKILAGKTTIAVAHRLSTIRSADNIMVMKDGEIVEQGTHLELSKAGGHYAELFNRRAGPEG